MKRETIVTGIFDEENAAYKAYAKLESEKKEYGYKIRQIGLLTKAQGHIIPLHGFKMKNKSKKSAIGGGVIGGIIGIFSGPLGFFLGTGIGAAIGNSARKKGTTLRKKGLLEKTLEKFPDEKTILIILIHEKYETKVDERLERYNAESVRNFSVDLLFHKMKEAKMLEKKRKKSDSAVDLSEDDELVL